MSFVAVAIGGSAIAGIGGSIIGANAASDAADKQTAAANHASDLQKEMYDQTRADQEPWRQAGGVALGQLSDPYFQKTFNPTDMESVDPGYNFRLQEGQKALERSAAAKGGLQTGGTLKAISRYGQDYASNEYQNAYNRFTNDQTNRFNRTAAVAGVGQTANNSLATAGQSYANNVGNNMMGAANAQGAAGIAGANAWSGGISGLSNLGKSWLDYTTAKQYAGGTQPSGITSVEGGWGSWA